jgi:hypothetical protein
VGENILLTERDGVQVIGVLIGVLTVLLILRETGASRVTSWYIKKVQILGLKRAFQG